MTQGLSCSTTAPLEVKDMPASRGYVPGVVRMKGDAAGLCGSRGAIHIAGRTKRRGERAARRLFRPNRMKNDCIRGAMSYRVGAIDASANARRSEIRAIRKTRMRIPVSITESAMVADRINERCYQRSSRSCACAPVCFIRLLSRARTGCFIKKLTSRHNRRRCERALRKSPGRLESLFTKNSERIPRVTEDVRGCSGRRPSYGHRLRRRDLPAADGRRVGRRTRSSTRAYGRRTGLCIRRAPCFGDAQPNGDEKVNGGSLVCERDLEHYWPRPQETCHPRTRCAGGEDGFDEEVRITRLQSARRWGSMSPL